MRRYTLHAVCVFILTGCNSGPVQPSPACTFSLSATSVTMGAAGGSGSISVSTASSCSWTARAEVGWISATGGASWTGPGTFSFMVAAATDTSARTGALTVAGQSVLVSQQGQPCAYTLLPPGRSFDAAGGTATFDVTTMPACGWSVASTASWLTIVSGGSGSGNAPVTYRVAANPEAASRAGSLTVADRSHDVTQTGLALCTVAVSRDRDTFPVSGGTGSFDVVAASGCAWAAASSAAWIRVTDPAGGTASGSRRVTYAVDGNAGAADRAGTIAVGGNTVAITQAGTASCAYAITPVDVRACMSEGFVRTITVGTGAGCPWTMSTAASWITIASGLSGAGSSSVPFTLGSNYDAARQGIIEVRWPAPTAGQNVRVAQAGCLYAVSRESVEVAAAGGDFSFDVISSSTDIACGGPLQDGCVWTAMSTAPWVTVLTSMPSNGDNRVLFRVAANGGASPRTAAITVRDRTVVIRQAGV